MGSAGKPSSPEGRLLELVERFEVPPTAETQLRCLAASLAGDPLAPTSVRAWDKVIDDHLADSLIALDLAEVRDASSILDIGSGAGLPGLPLAVALAGSEVVLLEGASRKCEYLARVISRCAIPNAHVVHARAEAWRAGLERFDLVTARALASEAVVLEYAAPLLRVGGGLVAWRGGREPGDEAGAGRAAAELGLRQVAIHQVHPYPEAVGRYLHVWLKVMETPLRFPRRPGVATKRPLGGEARSRPPSDRSRR